MLAGVRTRGAILTGLLGIAWTTPGQSEGRPIDPAHLAGVYKKRFKNGDVSGEQYISEDILEIVPINRDRAYVRTDLEFFNGHSCALHGVARATESDLVYTQPLSKQIGDRRCVLHIRLERGSLVLNDDGSCRDYCGARGMFRGSSFPVSSRRPIRYMARLKASREYAEALAEQPSTAR